MLTKEKKASAKEHAEPLSVSLYDFLYCDSRRVASFLSQFDDSGHLERIIQKESANIGSKRGWKVNAGAGASILGTGGQGAAGFEISPETSGSEASERVYDPLWANARAFLDYVESANLIQRDPQKTRIGQFLLATGFLSVFDMSMMKLAWDHPAVKESMRSSGDTDQGQINSTLNRKNRRAQGANHQTKHKDDEMNAGLNFLKTMPHKTISTLQAGDSNIWGILNESSIVGSASDLMLKHGVLIQGAWSMIGIVDALPAPKEFDADEAMRAIMGAYSLGTMGEAIAEIGPAIRGMLGRPLGSFGVTPILIFREISS